MQHLAALLDQESDNIDGKVRLQMPKHFDVASFVGGVVGLSGRNDFPACSIDAYSKQLAGDDQSLWLYRYDGHITWMVGGDNADVVEQQAKGYGAALERFITTHANFPYAANYNASALPFMFNTFAFLRTEFMGASKVEVEQRGTRQLWVDGGRIELFWEISENGPGQHRAP